MHSVEVAERIGQGRHQMVREHVEALDNLWIGLDHRRAKPWPTRRQLLERCLLGSFELGKTVPRLKGLEPPEANFAENHLVDAALVQYLPHAGEQLGTVVENPAGAPALANLSRNRSPRTRRSGARTRPPLARLGTRLCRAGRSPSATAPVPLEARLRETEECRHRGSTSGRVLAGRRPTHTARERRKR